jgi:hypothetical protein
LFDMPNNPNDSEFSISFWVDKNQILT